MDGCLCCGSVAPTYLIEADGRDWRFELHSHFGPATVRRNGDLTTEQPGERSPFWKAFELWIEQDKRVDGHRALWVPKPKERAEKHGGRCRRRCWRGWTRSGSGWGGRPGRR
jgi:hypothetical protein